ncbi:hypothetical protein ACHAW6_010020 [Cyclotella cf. meneghiniana]
MLAKLLGPALHIVHQVVKYSANPRLENGKAIIYIPDALKEFKYYCDADFAGNWDKLQSQVALSKTEAEYLAMSIALCEVILLMELINEIREHEFDIVNTQPFLYCKVFENNFGA